MQLSPNVEGQGVPFDSKGKPQQLIQTRLNSFNPLSVCPLLLSSKIWIWLNGCTTQPEHWCHLFVLSVPGFSVRHGDKCTHMHTLKHSVMVMMNQCQNLYHWVISKGTCLQLLMWGALSVLFCCFDFRLDLSYSESRLKDPQSGLLGPTENVNLWHNSLVSIWPRDDFTLYSQRLKGARGRIYIFVCALWVDLGPMTRCAQEIYA